MSRLEIDTNGFGHASFDLRTGRTVYLSDLPPWHTRAINYWRTSIPWPVKVLTGVATAGFAWQALEFYWLLKRRQSIHRAATKGEVEDYATLLYTLSARHLGGFLTNATIEAAVRDARNNNSNNNVVVFASGGWSHTPHSLAALPMFRYPGGVCHSVTDLDDRTLWWIACSLGKSMQLNGALAFILASVLLQQELAEKEEVQQRGEKTAKIASSKTRRLTYKGRAVTNVGICTGSLYQKVDSSNSTSSAALANPLTPLINRIDVACEIGTIDPKMVMQYQMENWGMIPDIRSEELARVCQFGTSNVLDYFRSHATLPVPHQTPELERVLWEKKQVKPPSGKDVWVWIEVDNRQRYAVDASLFFAKGIQTGYVDQLAAVKKDDVSSSSTSSSNNDSNPSSFIQRSSSALTSLWHRVQGLSTAVVDRLLCNAGELPSPSSMPLAHIFPYDRVLTASGLGYNSLVREDVAGPRNVLRFLQSRVLINEEEPNATHAQLRNLLLESLKLTNLPNKLLSHKLDSLPAYRDKVHVEKEWAEATPSYSPSHQNKKQQGRSAKNRAKKQKAAAAAAATPAHIEEVSNDEVDEEEGQADFDANSAANQVD